MGPGSPLAVARVGRDDNRFSLENQPAAVGNDRWSASPVSGLLFTGTLQPQRVEPSARRYCLGMPARSITAAHLPMSPARRAFNSSGVLALASMPSSA